MSVSLFNTNFYRAANSDLAGFNDTQLQSHFQNSGLNEGRRFSPLVDLNLYRSSNNDLANLSYRQAYEHLQSYGIQEGRKFSEFFDFNFYRANNGDLAGFNNEQLFDHLQTHGMREGRRFSGFFDFNFYRANNGDLAGFNNEQLFEHLQNYGLAEGRQFSSFVNLNFYRGVNSDLSALSNNQALQHLIVFGLEEGRCFSPFVDINLYRAANPDLFATGANNSQLLEHLQIFGVAEGRRFSVSFDSNYYRNNHSDLMTSGWSHTQLFEHFQRHGLQEGRASSESFSVSYYLANNSDLRGFSNQQAQQHFEIFGFREKRQASLPNSVSPLANRDDNTLGSAFNIGILNSSRNVTNQFIGTTDRNDYYRFTLAQLSNVSVSLTGLSDLVYLSLIHDTNGNNVYDSNDYEQLNYSSGSSYYKASISTPLDAATYFVRVYTNYSDDNSNYTLGLSATDAPRTTPKDPGNTFGTALDIGALNSNRSYTDFVGSADRNDYYRFSLTQNSNVNLSLSSLSDSAYISLIYDSNGNGVQDSNEELKYDSGFASDNALVNATLAAGTYLIRVYTSYANDNTNYTLGLSATAAPRTTPKDPGNTFGTALDIGALNSNRSYTDFVGSADRNDYYRFSLTQNSNVNLSLSGLSDSAYISLIYDSNGNGVQDSNEELKYDSGFASDNALVNATLASGSYLVRVYTNYVNDNTNYILGLSATAAPRTTPKDPGVTFDTAVDIGTLNSNHSYTDFVGSGDRDDYYRFTLAQNSKVNLSVSGLSDSARMDLIYDSNGNGVYDSGEELEYSYGSSYSNASIQATLAAGNYFVRIYTDYFYNNTNYSLGLTRTAYNANPTDPGSNMAGALDFGTLTSTRIYNDLVGSSDREDWYRFNLSGNFNFNLSLSNLTDSVSVDVVYDIFNNGIYDLGDKIRSSYASEYSNASIKVPLGTGTYFIRVYTESSDSNTGYTMALSL